MSRTLIVYIFGVGAILLVFLLTMLGDPDPVNPHFKATKSLLNTLFYSCSIVATIAVAYFGYQSVWSNKKGDLRAVLIFGIAGMAIVVLYILSFNPILAPNGDNAEYIINAKSLVERGGIYRLDTRTETPNTLAAPGLPLMLVPVYVKWGLDFIKMKYLIMFMGILILPLLFVLFRISMNFPASCFLSLIGFSSPYLVANSTTIMTETPYLFWSLLTLIFAIKYAQTKSISLINYLGLLIFLTLAISTRLIGVSLLLSLFVYLGLRLPYFKTLNRKGKAGYDRSPTLRFFVLFIPVLLVLFSWQWIQSQGPTSPLNIFLNMGVGQHLHDNFISLFNVLADLLFNPMAFRWYRLSPEHNLPLFNIAWLPVYLIIAIGIYSDLRRKRLMGLYTVSMILLILVASFTPQERVTMRYVSVIIPILIYHFYWGITITTQYVQKKWGKSSTGRSMRILRSLALIILFAINLHGNSHNVYTKSAVYNEWYESFLSAAQWCGSNLPDDAFLMSIKPRIVYLYSGLKGMPMVSERDIYSIGYAELKLKEIKENQVTHLIVDAISNSTKKNIYPILNSNKEKFEAIPIANLNDKCTVVEVLDW